MNLASKVMDREARRGFAFAAPGVLVTAILVLFPIAYVLYLSFFQVDAGSSRFVGFENFQAIMTEPKFGRIVWNTLWWTISTVVLAFLLGAGTAMLINQDYIRAKGMWRTILLLSWITPGVVKATVWKWLYSTDFGMINHGLMSLNILQEPVAWLMNPSYSLAAVILVQIWATFPYVMLMISAGLQAIPKDLFEVADMEGASFWQRIRYIYIPQLKDVTFICVLILVIWSLNEFSIIWIITQGGPMGSSQVLSLSIYDKFRSFDISGAAATSVLQLVACLVFAAWYIRKSNKEAG
ncbi:sugar ABC transporter permease [Xylanibacillus composti]|uniref:Sugar ABC transporter permease n=1 Tax=Xylanibacillus composti TaxID=1572762 RepID=A0A8J4H5U0_9BACL|nr:sugar ABC transporter permease [Xylanibacillus composti]